METESPPLGLDSDTTLVTRDTVLPTPPVLHGPDAEQPLNSSRAAASLAAGLPHIQHTLRTHFRARNACFCNIACRHELSSSIVSRLRGLAKRGAAAYFSLRAFLYASWRMPDAPQQQNSALYKMLLNTSRTMLCMCTPTDRSHVSQRRGGRCLHIPIHQAPSLRMSRGGATSK